MDAFGECRHGSKCGSQFFRAHFAGTRVLRNRLIPMDHVPSPLPGTPPEIPLTPGPEPEIAPPYRQEPEIPEPTPDPGTPPATPQEPEIVPDPAVPEISPDTE